MPGRKTVQTYIVEVMRYSRVSDVVCICIQKCSCMFGRMRDVILETFLNILSRLYCVHKYEFYINYLFSSSVYSTSYYYYTRYVCTYFVLVSDLAHSKNKTCQCGTICKKVTKTNSILNFNCQEVYTYKWQPNLTRSFLCQKKKKFCYPMSKIKDSVDGCPPKNRHSLKAEI